MVVTQHAVKLSHNIQKIKSTACISNTAITKTERNITQVACTLDGYSNVQPAAHSTQFSPAPVKNSIRHYTGWITRHATNPEPFSGLVPQILCQSDVAVAKEESNAQLWMQRTELRWCACVCVRVSVCTYSGYVRVPTRVVGKGLQFPEIRDSQSSHGFWRSVIRGDMHRVNKTHVIGHSSCFTQPEILRTEQSDI